MLDNKNGFTLLELLIAATLIGVLAMFATQAFRASASDIRVADAKARALLLANAAERYYFEYPSALHFPDTALSAFSTPGNCNWTGSDSVQNLVNCGFLEYRQVAFDNKDSKGEFFGSLDMWFKEAGPEKVTVCFRGKENGRVVDNNCTYCTDNNFEPTCD